MSNLDPTPTWPDPLSPRPPATPSADPLIAAPPGQAPFGHPPPGPAPAFAAPDLGYAASPYPTPPTQYPASPVAPGPEGGYGGYGVPPVMGGYPGYPQAARTNGMAIASMVVSIVSLALLGCYGLGGFVIGPVGAVLGHVARRKIRETNEQGAGMALAGVIMGWIATGLGVIVVALFVIFFVWLSQNDPSTFD